MYEMSDFSHGNFGRNAARPHAKSTVGERFEGVRGAGMAGSVELRLGGR